MSDDLLKIIGDYADRLAESQRKADASLAEFTAFDRLYTSGEWVAEWLEQSPQPKKHSNNWKSDSKSRFADWLRWKLEQAGRQTFTWRYTYYNLTAGEIVRRVPTLNNCSKLTEGALRPFAWALTNRFEDRLPEIVGVAIEDAGSVDALTNTHARGAVNTWKKITFGTRRDGTKRKTDAAISKAATAAAKAHKLRLKMLEDIAEIYQLAGRDEEALDEFNGLLQDLETFLNAKRAESDAA
jgi:hypothetical protein